jgi:hypothetical protein
MTASLFKLFELILGFSEYVTSNGNVALFPTISFSIFSSQKRFMVKALPKCTDIVGGSSGSL